MVVVNAKSRVLVNSTMLEEMQKGDASAKNNKLVEERGVSSSSTDHGGATTTVIPEDTWSNIDYFIQFWGMNESQVAAFLELRDLLVDVEHPYNRPNMVVRYLRTQNFHPAKSEQMFRNMLVWRYKNQVDDILVGGNYEAPPEILTMYPGAILNGCDRDGDPVFLSRMGVTDMVGLVEKYGHDDMLRFEIFKRESCMAGSWLPNWEQKAGRPVKHIVIIEDMHGLGRRLLSAKVGALYGEAMELDQNNYPDACKKIIIIRAPAIFRAAWTVAKRFFPLFIQQKMEFCGPSDYLKVLEKYMDLDILPSCIHPEGQGEAAPGQPPNFLGGRIKHY